jgi:hypothetical protein
MPSKDLSVRGKEWRPCPCHPSALGHQFGHDLTCDRVRPLPREVRKDVTERRRKLTRAEKAFMVPCGRSWFGHQEDPQPCQWGPHERQGTARSG